MVCESNDACGVFAVRLCRPKAEYRSGHLFYLAQNSWTKHHHRGQDSFGGAVIYFDRIGLEDVIHTDHAFFPIRPEFINEHKGHFDGHLLLTHTRYTTSKIKTLSNSQPIRRGCVVIAENGQGVNVNDLYREFGPKIWEKYERGLTPDISDSVMKAEILNYLLDKQLDQSPQSLLSALRELAVLWDGAYAMCGFLDNGTLFACLDPQGIRPLCYVTPDDTDGKYFAFSSESQALHPLGVLSSQVRHMKAGEVIIVERDDCNA